MKIIYTDGSCRGNPGPGAWAWLDAESEESGKGREANTTNNRMELTAAIRAVQSCDPGSEVMIVSDSKYVTDAFNKNWIEGWQARGWRNSAKKPVANQDLWVEMLEAVSSRSVTFEWVKGHSYSALNNKVDRMAFVESGKI